MKELQRQANSNIVIAFVGNKIDLVQPGSGGEGDSGENDVEEEDSSEADDATATPAAGGDASDATATAGSTAAGKRQVSREEAQAYAQEAGLLFAETSAKTGEGVVEVFTEIGRFLPTHRIRQQGKRKKLTGSQMPAKTIPIDQLLANSRQGAAGRAGGAAARGAQGGPTAGGERVDLTSGPGGNKEGACAC